MAKRRTRRWLIDGMNVIGSRPDRWWNDPDRAVRRMIDQLSGYAEATGDDVTVVFDRRPSDLEPGMHGQAAHDEWFARGPNQASPKGVVQAF